MSYRDHFILINRAPFCEYSEDRVQGSPNCSDSCPKLEQFLEAKRLSDKECIKLTFVLVTPLMCADVSRPLPTSLLWTHLSSHWDTGHIINVSQRAITSVQWYHTPFFLQFHHFWNSRTALLNDVRLYDKKLICNLTKKYRETWLQVLGSGEDLGVQKIPSQVSPGYIAEAIRPPYALSRIPEEHRGRMTGWGEPNLRIWRKGYLVCQRQIT